MGRPVLPRSSSRARRASGSRRSGSTGVEHARARGLRVLSSRPAEAERGSPTSGSAICSKASSTRPCRRSRRRGGTRSRWRSFESASGAPVDPRALGVAVRDVLQNLGERRRRSCSRSTTSSGSTRPRRARSPSRCAARGEPAFSCSSPGGWSSADRPSPARAGARLRSTSTAAGRAAERRALHRLLRDRLGRPFARQTLLRIHEHRVGTRSSRSSSPARSSGRRPARAARRPRDPR